MLKIREDGKRIRRAARWVLVVDDRGIVIDIIHNTNYVANIIAVIGPVVICGVCIPEAVLLEIGVSRGRPYAKAECKRDGVYRQFNCRKKAGELSLAQLNSTWPAIIAAIEECIREARAGWSFKIGWRTRTTANKMKEYERGVYFSISSKDVLLHEAFLLRDVVNRTYLERDAYLISYFLRRYKFVYYPAKQLKSFKGVHRVVDLWRKMTISPRWSARYAQKVFRMLPPAKRSLFEHVADIYKLDLGENYENDKELQFRARQLLFPAHLQVRLDGEGKVHGLGCSVFEVTFSKLYRVTNGV